MAGNRWLRKLNLARKDGLPLMAASLSLSFGCPYCDPGNDMFEEDIAQFGAALKSNEALRTLDLSGTHDSMGPLRRRIRDTLTLVVCFAVERSENVMQDVGAAALSAGLKHNGTLRALICHRAPCFSWLRWPCADND